MACSLNDLVNSQNQLIQEAALTLPHEFSKCTYSLGPIKQAVHLCLTCAVPRGICSSCSIACHTDHEQVELFPKRDFRCDCPTTAIPHTCTFHKCLREENTTNKYDHNFRGVFCRCSRPYDPKTELETMIQCISCEDWFHESCLNLRERPHPDVFPDPDPTSASPDAQGDDDDDSDASSNGLPPPLISAEDYDVFVCYECVTKINTLRRYAGTKGVIMVVRDDESGPWKAVDGDILLAASRNHTNNDLPPEVDDSESPTTFRQRFSSPPTQGEERAAKRRKISNASASCCLAPSASSIAKAIFERKPQGSRVSESPIGTGDIFLTEGWRQRWCRCDQCLPSFQAHPYLLEEEEMYEPPEDPDSGLSLEELGMRALARIPRDRAIDGIHAFNDMRDELMEYLRPFAQEGKVVEAVDVNHFFQRLLESRQTRN
ncbi:hypothetical protein F5J12DRAFT_722238 [Pisolithus orientalis]|uniref:uncharacterized protein n=1 Tax=Pisolithus orientalis TaxID=936130 RepID=UPI002224AF26|nr:uncharacterized protein F5J12DRAFT_722238 [Pisolithus orientalis]KAI6004376.1 hypothetical protein F5J12DRAFT_722238 [Pisolithus orientalis]